MNLDLDFAPARSCATRGSRQSLVSLPFRWNAILKDGMPESHECPVHASMSDYLIHRVRDIPRVAQAGVRFRHHSPHTGGALGRWFAALSGRRHQVSISVWRSPADLKSFVRSPAHLRIMREHRDTGALYTNAWTAERLDRGLIWRQAVDRLHGRVDGVLHH